jgi:acetyl-CoA C-acetyltransferase
MGMTGELVAERYAVSREQQDAFAVESHRRASAAIREGRFDAEILPVEVPQRKGPAITFDRDEPVREDTSIETLAALRPAFKADGTVTAGNAPGVNDGAAALVVAAADRVRDLGLRPLARIVGQATSGLEPKLVMMTPVAAVRKLVEKIGWPLDSIDLFELNEAFSVQGVAVVRELGLDPARVNVNGGAVALGHPIGASGARVLVTLLHALQQRQASRGVATLCLGGGNGVALAVERIAG